MLRAAEAEAGERESMVMAMVIVMGLGQRVKKTTSLTVYIGFCELSSCQGRRIDTLVCRHVNQHATSLQ